jgi:hypothetical protein
MKIAMPSDTSKSGMPAPNQGPEAFFAWLLDTLREPEDVYYEITPLSSKEYRFYACTEAGPTRIRSIDPRESDLEHGQTLRFVADPDSRLIRDDMVAMTRDYRRLSEPGYQHHARLTICDNDRLVITHVYAEKRSYQALPHMHQFCWDGSKMDHKAFQEGFMQLGGRTVVSPKDAVEIFHRMHMVDKEKYFSRSVRGVWLDRTTVI